MTPLKPSDPDHVLVRLNLPARLENVPRLMEPVLAAARTLALEDERLGDLELALEECLVNIVNHAYAGAGGPIDLICFRRAHSLAVRIEDEGIAFDPTAAAAPDLTADLDERPIGGLGVHLVRRLMDAVHYRREGNRNILTLTIHLPGEAPP